MKYNISDKKLKIMLDELGEEYKELLIERVLEDTDETDADQITLSELMQLDLTLKLNIRKSKRERRQNLMLAMVSVIGVIYSVFGLMLMMWSEFRYAIENDSTMLMAIALICVGVITMLVSLLYKVMSKMRSKPYRVRRRNIFSYEVINKWKEVEALVHELTPEKDSLSFSSMMKNLKDTNIISEEDVRVIHQLLSLRNKIVHSDDEDLKALDNVQIRSIFTQTDTVIAKLKRVI